MKSMKSWEAHCFVYWLRLESQIMRLEAWLGRHEPKLFYSLVGVFVLYAYFMASVECANYSNCWGASADLANAVFRLFGI